MNRIIHKGFYHPTTIKVTPNQWLLALNYYYAQS